MNTGVSIFFLVASVAMSVLVLLLCREIMCWYWKINLALEQFARVEQLLRNMNENLEVLAENSARSVLAQEHLVDSSPPQQA